MQMDVHKTLYPYCTTKRILHVTETVVKMLFIGSNASFSLIFPFTPYKITWLTATSRHVSLHHLPQLSALNNHMRQNAYHRNLK